MVPVKVEVRLDADADVATIVIEGPPGVWFGIAFGATTMAQKPYAIILDGSDDIQVEERQLGMYAMGSKLTGVSVQKVSQETRANGMVAVELRRPLAAAGAGYYTFDPSAASIDVMVAVGRSQAFGYHSRRAADSLKLMQSVAGLVQTQDA